MLNRIVQTESVELAHRGTPRVYPLQDVLGLHHGCLGPRSEEHENRNQQQDGLSPAQGEDRADHSQHLSEKRRHRSGLFPGHHKAEQGTKGPASIHWKSRNHIEQNKDHIHPDQTVQQAAAARDSAGVTPLRNSLADQDQNPGDEHIDHRPGYRHHQFMKRLLRNPTHTRHPAEGKQRDLRRSDAIAECREDMAKLVQQHTQKNQQEKKDPGQTGTRTRVRRRRDSDPSQQEEKGEVNPDFRSGDSRNFEGPGHVRFQFRKRGPGDNLNLPKTSRLHSPCFALPRAWFDPILALRSCSLISNRADVRTRTGKPLTAFSCKIGSS